MCFVIVCVSNEVPLLAFDWNSNGMIYHDAVVNNICFIHSLKYLPFSNTLSNLRTKYPSFSFWIEFWIYVIPKVSYAIILYQPCTYIFAFIWKLLPFSAIKREGKIEHYFRASLKIERTRSIHIIEIERKLCLTHSLRHIIMCDGKLFQQTKWPLIQKQYLFDNTFILFHQFTN